MAAAQQYVGSGFSQSAQYADAAWGLVQGFITSDSYTAFSSISFGPVDIVLDPALTAKELTTPVPSGPDFPELPVIDDNFSMPDIPAKPEVSLPDKPTLKDHVIPDFTTDIALPGFDGVLPSIDLTPIEEINVVSMYSFLIDGYKPQISEVKAILLDRIVNGGTGLPTDVETKIWDRNLERDQQALQDGIDSVASQWANMNFSLPDGLLAHSVMELNKDFVNKRLDASRDIAIKQAELEQLNITESLKLVVAIEDAFNNVMVQYCNVGVQAMSIAAEVAVKLYNTTVQYYNLLIESYKAKAEVFNILVRARLGDVEVYKARIEGIAQAIRADSAKVELYLAQISGEEARLKAYETELRGVIAQIEMVRAWLDVGKTRIELFATQTRALTEKFSSEIEGFKAEVSALSNLNETRSREKDISLREQIAEWDIRLKEYEFLVRDKESQTNVELERMRTLAQVGAHVVAGALAASHAAASISESESTVLSGSI